MDAIGTVALDPDVGTQQRPATGQQQRRPPDPPPATGPARVIEDGREAVVVSAVELLTEAELLREAELRFQANQPRPEDEAPAAVADPTGEIEQTRLGNLIREAEQKRVGELLYPAEQTRLAEETAQPPTGLPISVFL
jgi:hypothetical protein